MNLRGGLHYRMPIVLRRSDRLFVLTGAGIIAESGIPTFRGQEGLWEGHRIEDVATPQAFARDPELVWRFYSMRRVKRDAQRLNVSDSEPQKHPDAASKS
jgi:NAD-dependent deacetylase